MDHPWTHTHIYGSGVTSCCCGDITLALRQNGGNDMGGKPKLSVT